MTDIDSWESGSDNPLVIETRRLHRQPGAAFRLDIDADVPEGWANDVIAVPADSHPPVDLLLESVLDGILVTGDADVRFVGTCARCLDEIDRVEAIRFRQFFAYPGAEVADADNSGDVAVMDGHLVDLRPAFRDAVLLALPLSPTCRSDCPGLCAECGFRLADDPGHRHEHLDPRWSALAQLQESPATTEGE